MGDYSCTAENGVGEPAVEHIRLEVNCEWSGERERERSTVSGPGKERKRSTVSDPGGEVNCGWSGERGQL